jgi:hypothetical protein
VSLFGSIGRSKGEKGYEVPYSVRKRAGIVSITVKKSPSPIRKRQCDEPCPFPPVDGCRFFETTGMFVSLRRI